LLRSIQLQPWASSKIQTPWTWTFFRIDIVQVTIDTFELVMNLPPAIRELAQYAEKNDHGRVFMPDASVWQRYFEPSFSKAYQRWNRVRGTRNLAGYSFEFEIALTEKKVLPNAICAYDTNSHYVLLYHTLPMYLLEFFNRLLCSSSLLENIGDAQHEVSCEDKGFHSPPGFAIHCGEANPRHIDEIIDIFGPRCPKRRDVAFELFQYAMEFVIEHEMAHAVNGHAHYVERDLGVRDIREATFRNSGQGPGEYRVRSHFEGQADKGSYFSVIARPLLDRLHTPYQVISSGDTALISEVRQKILAGALLGVFWILTDLLFSNWGHAAYETWGDHPSSLARGLGFALMPDAQAKLLPPELGFFMHEGSRLACAELLKQSEISGLFRPFQWLRRTDMYSVLFEPNILSDVENQHIVSHLEKYRYRP
jgi:hypothetical protein